MSLAQKFGGSAVKPAQPQYETIALTANIALVWPLESTLGVPYVAAEIDVTPTLAGLSLAMPSALQGGTGVACVIQNVGANSFTLTDNGGNQIAVIAAAQAWIISLRDNTTVNGLWRATQLGATTSNAQAGQLADNFTLQANGTVLQVEIPTNYFMANTLLSTGQRGSLNVWQGGGAQGSSSGTFQLDLPATLGAAWFAFADNQSTGTLTIQPNGGTINSQSTVVLQPGNSALLVCDGTNFNAVGVVINPLPVSSGGTGASSATGGLINLGGSTVGIAIFTSPTVAAILSLLGLSTVTFFESTVSTNQTLTSASGQTCLVCTSALTVTLPITTSLTTSFVFCIYAQGGNVTVTPNAADKINNGAAGANYTVTSGTSAMFTTDANGNWWPFFTTTGGTVTSVGLALPAEFTVSGSPVTTTGTLMGTKATQVKNTVWAGPNTGGNAAPTFRALTSNDIPIGALGSLIPFLRGFIDGFETGAPGGGQTLTIGPGACVDNTNAFYIGITTQYTKTMGAWAVGSGNGGLDTGVVQANKPYFVYSIFRNDTGVADYLFSLSGTAPTLPANYTVKRGPISWFMTDGASNIWKFQQRGDELIYGSSVADINLTATTVAALVAVTVPVGFVVNVLMRVELSQTVAGNFASLLSSPDETSAAVTTGLASVFSDVNTGAGSVVLSIRTNTAAQIRHVENATNGSVTLTATTYGFIWTRGRNS